MREQEPVISIATSQRAWAAELVRFLSDHGGARLAGTVLTPEDALALDYEVLIIDDIASFLTPRLLERVQRVHRRVVGVYDPEHGDAGRQRLEAIGIDAIVEAGAGPERFLELLASLSFGEPSPATETATSPRPVTGDIHVTSVVGGALAGDVAIALAGCFEKNLRSAVLVDADTVYPMIAQRLVMPLAPNLLSALDSMHQVRSRVSESFVVGPYGATLILGLPEASAWPAVRADDIADLIEQLATDFNEVVLKVSPHVEDLSHLGGRAGRFEVGRTALRLSTDIAYVAESSPVGLSCALSWIASARLVSSGRIHVLFGDAPSSRFQRGELIEELNRTFTPSSLTWLPDDQRRVRAAWNGELVRPGPFTKSVSRFADVLPNANRVGAP